jgi:hypothetical protein
MFANKFSPEHKIVLQNMFVNCSLDKLLLEGPVFVQASREVKSGGHRIVLSFDY